MVENNGKLQFLYFRDTLYKPSGRYTCQSSTASSHHASLSTQSQINTCPKGILELVFYCYAFIFKSWALMG